MLPFTGEAERLVPMMIVLPLEVSWDMNVE